MTNVDMICYEKAKKIIDGKILDIGHICQETRQNQWLKEIFLTKVHLKYLDQSFKMVIDPRNEKAVARRKKTKLTPLEK